MELKKENYPFKPQVEALFALEYSRENQLTKLLHQLEKTLIAAHTANQGKENLAEKSLKVLEQIAQLGEQGTAYIRSSLDSLMRDISYHYSPDCTYQVVWDIGERYGFDYDVKRELLQIKMSVMLPFALNTGANYLSEKLQWQLEHYLAEYEQVHGVRLRLTPALVVFIHHYDRKRIELNYVRDYDNQERRRIINAIQNTRILSDNPTRMVDMNLAVADEHSFTELLITKVEHISELLATLNFSLYLCPQETLTRKEQKDTLKEAKTLH